MQGETPPSDGATPTTAPVEQAWSLAEPAQEQGGLDAADGAVVSPQPAPPAYSDNNPFS